MGNFCIKSNNKIIKSNNKITFDSDNINNPIIDWKSKNKTEKYH